ncbi:hypothetical protein V5F77_05345 [Xanthobacter sp. DSM 24535]|uniref:hypothetical protein n=1 Tax=Roseixanthobacter psychrophilus TaxID=3119917 RepID=UPI00372788C6
MSTNATLLIISLMSLAFNLVIYGVCAYAVFWLGHSGWWFLLAMVISASVTDSTAREA